MEPVKDAGDIGQEVHPCILAAVMLKLVEEHIADLTGRICMGEAGRNKDGRAEKPGDDRRFEPRCAVDGNPSFYAKTGLAEVKDPKELSVLYGKGAPFQLPEADQGTKEKSSRGRHPADPDKGEKERPERLLNICRYGKILHAAKGRGCLAA